MSRELYNERLKRIETAAHLGTPDRVPVVLLADTFSVRHTGMKMSEFIWGGQQALDAIADVAEEFELDGVLIPSPTNPTGFALGYPSKVNLPGRQLDDYEQFQWKEESPVMTPDDYNFIIQNGWAKFLPVLIPRMVDYMPVEDVFPFLARAGEEYARAVEGLKERGIVTFDGGTSIPSFETFSSGRTISEFFKDLYKRPQQVIDAMEAALPDVIATGIQIAKASGVNRIFVSGTRASTKFISLPKFEKFFWPYMKRMVSAYLDAGLEVNLHLDQDWTENLEYFKELPAGKISMSLDGFTDIFRAKEVLNGHIALIGDVHPTLLCLGTLEEVDDYCKKLIAEVGKGGGFILAQGCTVPIDAKPENVKAMVEAAHKYGVY
jgi:hypothetical protein